MGNNCLGVIIKINLAMAFFLLYAKSEFFSAVSELGQLVLSEDEIVKSLRKYIGTEEERLQKLRRLSQRYNKLHRTASINAEVFLANPVNAFLLVKHLTEDWKVVTDLIQSSESRKLLENKTVQNMVLPGKEDLNGAADALIRLQQTYLIDTGTLAEGRIKGVKFSSELTANDCFELGRQAFWNNLFNYTLLWMEESLKRLERETIPTADKVDILEFIAFAAHDVGNFTYGLAALDKIIEINPNFPRVTASVKYYQLRKDHWDTEQALEGKSPPNEKESTYVEVDGKNWSEKEVTHLYEKLCRGESVKTPEEKSKLHCHYTTNNNSYLLLQPVKVEVLNQNPPIILFHDIIKDSECNVLREIATPKLLRAVVQDTFTGKLKVSTNRISKSAVFYDDEHVVFDRLNKKIQDITGLSTELAEPISIINYGIGGHFKPHFDFLEAADKVDLYRELGNRIATWISYLSEVPAGGSTVFPIIGVEVKPVKGAAVFWYNLYKNGKGDRRTFHAACPVLIGSKWVSTKWMHEVGQEFRKPCSLDQAQ